MGRKSSFSIGDQVLVREIWDGKVWSARSMRVISDTSKILALYMAPKSLWKQAKNGKGERYSPATCIGADKRVVQGNPDTSNISTSYVERQNLTMRMSMRRFTRLTNAFSKKLENHILALALYFMYYNFARPHKTLANPYPKTPAMAAGVSNYIWTVEDIVKLVN